VRARESVRERPISCPAMRRLAPLTLVCALLCLFAGSGPALAATGQHHRHHHRAHATATTTAARSATATSTASVNPAATGGKPTTSDGLQVLNDCQSHGQLTKSYPVSWLRKGLAMMSSDTAQYSNCSTVLHQAILASIHPGSGSGGSGSGSIIVIIVVIVLVLLAGLLALLALRRRRGGGPPTPAV
jgi:MYXO-CTERM domain-containing protein